MWNPRRSVFWRDASPPPNGSAKRLRPPPPTTAHGALLNHITGGHIDTIEAGAKSFQPMNINFGLFPPPPSVPTRGPDGERLRGPEKSVARKRAMSARALADLETLARRRHRRGRRIT